MIIRILGEGQYEITEADLEPLNLLDTRLQAAVDARDRPAFSGALHDLLAAVRERGTVVPDTVIAASDLVLPAPDASLDDVVALLGTEGLIPG